MGLFGNDQAQDARLDAIEEWLHGLTGMVQKHQLDTAKLRLDLLKLQARVEEKLSEEDFDPVIMQLSNKITEARAVAKKATDSAEEGWTVLQKSAMTAREELNEELDEAAKRLDND